MDVSLFELLLYLGLPLLLGTGILALFGILPRHDRLSYLGWAWVAGSLGTGLVLAAWLCSSPSSMGPALPAGMLAAGAALVWGLACSPLLRARATLEPPATSQAPAWETWFFRAALAFVLFVTLERILFGSLHAVVTTDEASFWSFRAKVLFHEGGFGEAYAEGIRQTGQGNADYPLLNPLLQLWAFVTSGQITHLANRFIILIFCPALVLVLAGALRRWTRPALAGCLLLLLANMQPFLFATAVGYSDVMVALGALLILDAALRWNADQKRAWLWLGTLGLALCMASKNDGVMVFLALAGALGLSWLLAPQKKRALLQGLKLLPFAAPALLIHLLGKFHNRSFQFENTFFEGARQSESSAPNGSALGTAWQELQDRFLERSGPIAEFFSEQIFFAWDHSSFLLAAFLILACVQLAKHKLPALRFATFFIALLLLGIMLVFVTLPFELEYHLRTAGRRVVIDVLPMTMLWLAAFAGKPLAQPTPSPSSKHPTALVLRAVTLYLICAALLSTGTSLKRLTEHAPASFGYGLEWSTARRLQNAFGREDARYKIEHGLTSEVYDAIQKHVPEDGFILANLPKDGRLKIAFSMQIMTYPRRFRLVPLPVEGTLKPEELAPLVGQLWVLDLIGLDEQLAPHFKCLDRGRDWALWR